MSSTREHEVEALRLKHKCEACGRTFPTQRGMKTHVARWCDGGGGEGAHPALSPRLLADKAVDEEATEALRRHVSVGQEELENVYSFHYLGARLQCDGEDEADVLHRMAIAQTTFSSLTNIWSDHRLSRTLKLAVCSTLTHVLEAWALTDPVMRCINGFNSRCLHLITGEDYSVTATTPAYNLLLAIRWRRLRYLGHILRMPESKIVRRALVVLCEGDTRYPERSLFVDCPNMDLAQLVAPAMRRKAWNKLVNQLTLHH